MVKKHVVVLFFGILKALIFIFSFQLPGDNHNNFLYRMLEMKFEFYTRESEHERSSYSPGYCCTNLDIRVK